MINNEELEKKCQLTARILERHNYEFSAEAGRYRIGSPPVRFGDYGRPLLYSVAGLLFGLSLFRWMGPTEGIVITATALLGFMYTWLLYHSKVQLFKTKLEISQEGIRLTRPDEKEILLTPAAIQDLPIVLDPEEKVKSGSLRVISESGGELELLKLTGESQKFVKDDLEKIRDFMTAVWGRQEKIP